MAKQTFKYPFGINQQRECKPTELPEMGGEKPRLKNGCIVIAIVLLITPLVAFGANQNIDDQNIATENQGSFVSSGSEESRSDQYFYKESEGASSTTSTSYVDKTNLTFALSSAGNYTFLASAELAGSSTSYDVKARLLIDGTTNSEYVSESEEATIYHHFFIAHRTTELASGTHTLKIQYATESSSATAYIRRARIAAIKVTNYKFNETTTEQSLGTSYANITTLTFSVGTTGEYLIIGSAECRAASTSNSVYGQTLVDGSSIGESLFEGQDVADYKPHFTANITNLNAGLHTIQVQGRSESGTMYMRRARISVIPISGNFDNDYISISEAETTNGATTPANKTVLTFTPPSQATYLILSLGILGGDARNGAAYNAYTDTQMDGAVIAEGQFGLQDNTDRHSLLTIKNITLDARSHTINRRYWSGASASPDASLKNTRVIALTPITSPAIYVAWNQSTLNLGTGVQGGGDLNGSANITSTGSNTNVTVTCDSGNCSVITETWDDTTDMSNGQSLGVTFTCDDSTIGSFWALYNVTSVEDTTPNQINVSCTISEPANVTQIHYRWRNDDGVEGNKTFSATTGDGYVQASSATYSTAHDASTGTVNTSGNEIRVGQQLTGGTYYIDRSTLFFDTSAIPDDAVISNATLTLYVSGDNSGTDFDIQIQRPTLTLDQKDSKQYTTNSRHVHGWTWDGSQYLYGSMRESANYPLIKINKDNLSSYTEYNNATYNADCAIYWNDRVYSLSRRESDSITVLMEFNPSTATWTQRINFGTTGYPGGLVYAFGYMWAGQQPNVLRKINTSSWTYSTYTYTEMTSYLHWVGANSNNIWITGYPGGNAPLLKVDPSNPSSYTSYSMPHGTYTDDQTVDDEYGYFVTEIAPCSVDRFNISASSFTTFDFSGTDVSYGIAQWNFTNVYGESENWLVFITAADDKIIWVEKPSITEVNRFITTPPADGDAPNEILPIGDYLYVTFWGEDPLVVKKYRLDKPEITSPLEAADYDKKFYRKNGGTFNTSGISGTGTIEIPLSTAGINWINKTGNTTLNLRSSRDINSNTPTGNEYITFYSANKGSGYAPVLTVTYQNQTPATWKVAEDTNVTVQKRNENLRVRFSVQNTGGNASNYNYRLQVAAKGAAACCEDIASGNFADVTTVTGGCGSAVACMNNSTYFVDQDPTTRQLSIPDSLTFTAGRMVEDPSNQTTAFTLNHNYFTEFEYNFYFTNNALSGTTYCFRISNASAPLDNYTKVATVTLEA